MIRHLFNKTTFGLSFRINLMMFGVISILGWAFTYGLAYFVDRMMRTSSVTDTTEVVDYVIGISMTMMYVMFGILAICTMTLVRMHNTKKQYVSELRNAKEQKVSIERDIEITATIQQGMLPTDFPDRTDIDVYGRLTPAKVVGGDLYDCFVRQAANDYGGIDDYLFFCIGDVSGKGIPASLLMSVTTHLVRNMSRRTTNVHRICNSINATIAERNTQNMFVTLFVGVMNLRTGRLEYCNAGHNPPILMRDGVATFMSPEVNLPIGVDPTTKYKSEAMHVLPGDILFLYTDGVNEAENSDKQLFGNEQTLKAVTSAANSVSMKVLTANVLASVHAFADGAEQSDDLTMVAIKRV